MRSTTTIKTNLDPNTLQKTLQEFFAQNGFRFVKHKGEKAYKKGRGFLVAPKFFTASFATPGKLVVESWVPLWQFLPGVYGGESGLEGSFGIMLKIPARRVLKALFAKVAAPGSVPEGYFPKK
ncbi:MAG: hypothetical protein LBT20_05730 [Clostridiales bacterium]|jgi:hypothetical protein|nr:hypothetical protein [Clostridiales bacterium]